MDIMDSLVPQASNLWQSASGKYPTTKDGVSRFKTDYASSLPRKHGSTICKTGLRGRIPEKGGLIESDHEKKLILHSPLPRRRQGFRRRLAHCRASCDGE